VDCAIVHWWLGDHWLHGDLVAGFVHLHDGNNELHGDWSHERHELHVHGDGHECCGYWFRVVGVGRGCSCHCSGCADIGGRYSERECSVGGVVDCAIVHWWLCHHWLHGDFLARFVHLHNGNDLVHGDWSHEWHELHVHGDGHE